MTTPEDPSNQLLNVADWRGRFSKFIQESSYRPRSIAPRLLEATFEGENNVSLPAISAAVLKRNWVSFIESLEREGKSFLVSHLQMCELESIQDAKVNLKCIKKFSFETLRVENVALNRAAQMFFGGLVEIEVSLDKSGLAEARRSERSPDEVFLELSKTSELIKYLIEHFGVEPIY